VILGYRRKDQVPTLIHSGAEGLAKRLDTKHIIVRKKNGEKNDEGWLGGEKGGEGKAAF
jgi:hypothetical protein